MVCTSSSQFVTQLPRSPKFHLSSSSENQKLRPENGGRPSQNKTKSWGVPKKEGLKNCQTVYLRLIRNRKGNFGRLLASGTASSHPNTVCRAHRCPIRRDHLRSMWIRTVPSSSVGNSSHASLIDQGIANLMSQLRS